MVPLQDTVPERSSAAGEPGLRRVDRFALRYTSKQMSPRERLAAAKYDSLERMMSAYAEEAVRQARTDHRETLDGTSASLAALERILNRLCPAPDPLEKAEAEWLTLLWGSYFGELLRREFGGEWTMSVYPGSEFSVPTLELGGASRLYPLLKVNRRLTLGASEELPAFHRMIVARVGAAAKVKEPLTPLKDSAS